MHADCTRIAPGLHADRRGASREQAEIINGRIAMTAITLALGLSLDPTLKAIVAVYRAAKSAAEVL